MKTYEINKTFPNQEACDAWEEKNIPNRTYDGHNVLMVSHQCNAGSPEVTLTTIMTF